jgi:hypothetical protein
MVEEGGEEAAIGAFLAAHEGHTQDVEVRRGTWFIYCCCGRCDDIHTYEVAGVRRVFSILSVALGRPIKHGCWAEPMRVGRAR